MGTLVCLLSVMPLAYSHSSGTLFAAFLAVPFFAMTLAGFFPALFAAIKIACDKLPGTLPAGCSDDIRRNRRIVQVYPAAGFQLGQAHDLGLGQARDLGEPLHRVELGFREFCLAL